MNKEDVRCKIAIAILFELKFIDFNCKCDMLYYIKYKVMQMKKNKNSESEGLFMKKIISTIICIIAFLIVFFLVGLNDSLSVSKISLSSKKVDTLIRIALVSDLHSTLYGDDQTELIEAISNSNPDIVCLTGDIFDDSAPNKNAEIFIAGISQMYPCYYVTGNHEYWAEKSKFDEQMSILKKYGVVRLKNESKKIFLNGQNVLIIGVDDPESGSFDLSVANEADKNCFTILLSHRPEYIEDYSLTGVDLVLSGHAHGGQWRIPIILKNGFIAPDQGKRIFSYNLGIFPKYTSGMYTKANTHMVVSRGLQKRIFNVPRFYNKPEIVIVEIK